MKDASSLAGAHDSSALPDGMLGAAIPSDSSAADEGAWQAGVQQSIFA